MTEPTQTPTETKKPQVNPHTGKESSRAFDAFQVYRDLGPTRTVLKAQATLATRPLHPLHTQESTLKRWSARFDWVNRAKAWDMEQDEVAKEEMRRQAREMVKRHAQAGMILQSKAAQRLSILKPEDMTVKEALDYMDRGARLERLSRGEPETVMDTGKGGLAARDFAAVYKELKDEEEHKEADTG